MPNTALTNTTSGKGSATAEQLLAFVRDEVCLIDLDLKLDTDLLLTGAVDSLGVIRITQWLEDEMNIEVDPAEVTLENFQTVGLIVNYVQRQPAQNSSTAS